MMHSNKNLISAANLSASFQQQPKPQPPLTHSTKQRLSLKQPASTNNLRTQTTASSQIANNHQLNQQNIQNIGGSCNVQQQQQHLNPTTNEDYAHLMTSKPSNPKLQSGMGLNQKRSSTLMMYPQNTVSASLQFNGTSSSNNMVTMNINSNANNVNHGCSSSNQSINARLSARETQQRHSLKQQHTSQDLLGAFNTNPSLQKSKKSMVQSNSIVRNSNPSTQNYRPVQRKMASTPHQYSQPSSQINVNSNLTKPTSHNAPNESNTDQTTCNNVQAKLNKENNPPSQIHLTQQLETQKSKTGQIAGSKAKQTTLQSTSTQRNLRGQALSQALQTTVVNSSRDTSLINNNGGTGTQNKNLQLKQQMVQNASSVYPMMKSSVRNSVGASSLEQKTTTQNHHHQHHVANYQSKQHNNLIKDNTVGAPNNAPGTVSSYRSSLSGQQQQQHQQQLQYQQNQKQDIQKSASNNGRQGTSSASNGNVNTSTTYNLRQSLQEQINAISGGENLRRRYTQVNSSKNHMSQTQTQNNNTNTSNNTSHSNNNTQHQNVEDQKQSISQPKTMSQSSQAHQNLIAVNRVKSTGRSSLIHLGNNNNNNNNRGKSSTSGQTNDSSVNQNQTTSANIMANGRSSNASSTSYMQQVNQNKNSSSNVANSQSITIGSCNVGQQDNYSLQQTQHQPKPQGPSRMPFQPNSHVAEPTDQHSQQHNFKKRQSNGSREPTKADRIIVVMPMSSQAGNDQKNNLNQKAKESNRPNKPATSQIQAVTTGGYREQELGQQVNGNSDQTIEEQTKQRSKSGEPTFKSRVQASAAAQLAQRLKNNFIRSGSSSTHLMTNNSTKTKQTQQNNGPNLSAKTNQNQISSNNAGDSTNTTQAHSNSMAQTSTTNKEITQGVFLNSEEVQPITEFNVSQNSQLQLQPQQQNLSEEPMPDLQIPVPEPQPSKQQEEENRQQPEVKQTVAQIFEERRKKLTKQFNKNYEVCDLLDMRDQQTIAEHAPVITKNLLKIELDYMIPPNFIKDQTKGVTEKLRAFLIDWLAEIHYKFQMWQETLYVAIKIIDMYLSKIKSFPKMHLQTLGLAALLIAGKYEEIYPPDLKSILKVANLPVTKPDVLTLERHVLLTLEFDLTSPSILRFVERFARLSQMNEQQLLLAMYFAETALLDTKLVCQKPSQVAALCIYASQKIYKGQMANRYALWNQSLAKLTGTGYKEKEIAALAQDLIVFVQRVEQSSFKTIRRKFSSTRFQQVAFFMQNFQQTSAAAVQQSTPQ